MKYLQKLGKALMLPVAVLPICGLLMGIGYALCPAAMQGGDIKGLIPLIGLFLVKAGAALIDNMALLFVIGVGVGLSKDNDGTGGVAALASWLMITTLLNTGFVTTIMPAIAENANKTLAFDKIVNPFIGIFTVITYYVGFRAGFSFSAGCTDLVFSSTLPAASKTWLIIPLGIAAFIVFYVVFRFAITKFDLKTPGREDDDVEAEKQAELGNNDYTQVASIILEGIGGKENVVEIDNCITRLRLEVKDNTIVDEKKIKSAGVAGVLRPGKNNVQVIIGTKVQFVADEFKKLCK